ncbi:MULTISPECIES: universal stress protein [Acinetobacter]|jgi:nucleotide-binding universal stress UspA family protein|uniref:Universal stress protein n=2 Tax=Acinetobacter TaxID=469 RepID=A0A1H3IWF0_9GAMM|nr:MULTISPECIES: universal stress protein [Acinetobacter]KAB0654151.1 universal stress protein [Acinetobacter bohemicus]OTG95868.1 universal stress protein [Acinetobacter sp. ANC 4654]OTG99129.1 universal stress protein [Acinetobacter sp. ANC 4973]SDY32083.1 Nucleotide-binding universal stress protein, UspA family [Acinetobacter kyonggiensis]SFS48516.1 Nucleotide-binding universal stress protein, UspA family [Acinetobacter bohemicus]
MAYHNILVPVDGSETSHAAVEKAVEFAKAFGSKITVVQALVLDPYIAAEYISASQTNDLIERARTSIEESLAAAKAKFNEQGIEVETKLLEGQVIHREIIRAAEELHADLIIIGSHGRTGFKKLFLGSVAQSLLGESHVPVLIVRQP